MFAKIFKFSKNSGDFGLNIENSKKVKKRNKFSSNV